MCGRATLVTSTDEIREMFDLAEVPEMTPRYNIAPSQPLPVIRAPGRLELLKWGPKFINAKVEGATTKPANRCLVVVDGFYEWRHGDRQPFYFHRVDGMPFALGGVVRTIDASCAIVTCPAGDAMIDIHDRMPLVLARSDWGRWLDGEKPPATLADFERYPVSRLVNNARNEDPRCVERLHEAPP